MLRKKMITAVRITPTIKDPPYISIEVISNEKNADIADAFKTVEVGSGALEKGLEGNWLTRDDKFGEICGNEGFGDRLGS
jgi:hypothetical protein